MTTWLLHVESEYEQDRDDLHGWKRLEKDHSLEDEKKLVEKLHVNSVDKSSHAHDTFTVDFEKRLAGIENGANTHTNAHTHTQTHSRTHQHTHTQKCTPTSTLTDSQNTHTHTHPHTKIRTNNYTCTIGNNFYCWSNHSNQFRSMRV